MSDISRRDSVKEKWREEGQCSVTEFGFSLHAATRAAAEDARGREALCKYVLRPPLPQERLSLLPDGLVRNTLRKPFRDGTFAILAEKTFKEDIDRCPKCGGKMKLKALVQEPENIARFLRHLG